MRFRVTNQYIKGPEHPVGQFKNQADAELFVAAKIDHDAQMKVSVTYRLYDSFDLIKEYNASDQAAGGTSSGSGQATGTASSGGKGSGAGFKPTPFNTTPTPSGAPKNWWLSDDEEEKKK